MAGQAIETLFNDVYDKTNRKVLIYITAKCGNPCDIQDIFQETYAELFLVLQKRGAEYVQNAEAFAMQVAKQRVYRHYTLLQKLKDFLPTTLENREGDAFELALQAEDSTIDDQIVNDALLAEIRLYLRGKPAVTRKIFYLYYSMELTIPQIAAELQMTESNVKNRLYRTLSELRTKYQP